MDLTSTNENCVHHFFVGSCFGFYMPHIHVIGRVSVFLLILTTLHSHMNMINVYCCPFGHQGYAIHAVNLLRTLALQGFDVACYPQSPVNSSHEDPVVMNALSVGLSAGRPSCAAIMLDLPEPERVRQFSGKPRIFYTMSEVDRIPPEWVGVLNSVDEVWTTSAWGQNVFIASGITRRITIVPEGVDPNVFKAIPHSKVKRNIFRFLTIAKFEERKNYAALFQAYVEEFRADEPVELVIHSGSDTGHLSKFILDSDFPHPPIVFSTPIRSQQELVGLYHTADAFVLPTRGEGWGLPIMEAMCCGLPVIATGIGPILEYATSDTAMLLDYELVPATDPNVERFDRWFRFGRWAEPNILQLRRCMRQLFEDPAKGRRIGECAAAHIRANWTLAHVAPKLYQALRLAGV